MTPLHTVICVLLAFVFGPGIIAGVLEAVDPNGGE